jgi:hypothetical protein
MWLFIHLYSAQKIKMHKVLLRVAVRLHVMVRKYRENFQSIILRIIITNSEVKLVPEHTS